MVTKRQKGLSKIALERIDAETRARYDSRLKEFGMSAKALGWIDEKYQRKRFEELMRHIDFNDKSIIDIGCGFGDLAVFLEKSAVSLRSYLGIDINPRLLDAAKAGQPKLVFKVGNPLLKKLNYKADIVTIIGIANLKFEVDNYLYMKEMMRVGFTMAKECLVANMISNRLVPGKHVNPRVFHYSPERLLRIGLGISRHVELIHDSVPMPQNEIYVVLRKEAHGSKDS